MVVRVLDMSSGRIMNLEIQNIGFHIVIFARRSENSRDPRVKEETERGPRFEAIQWLDKLSGRISKFETNKLGFYIVLFA